MKKFSKSLGYGVLGAIMLVFSAYGTFTLIGDEAEYLKKVKGTL